MKTFHMACLGAVAVLVGCDKPICVEGLSGVGSVPSKYEKYDCSHYAGTGSAIHFQLGGSTGKGGSPATGGTIASGGSLSGGTTSNGGSPPASGGSEAFGGSETSGGSATGGSPEAGGAPAEGGAPPVEGGAPGAGGAASGGSEATGGTSAIPLCPDGGVNCVTIDQLGGLAQQNVFCSQTDKVVYGAYHLTNSCPCAVGLRSVLIRTDTASAFQSTSLSFTCGANSFSKTFDVSQPTGDTWSDWASPQVVLQGGTCEIELTAKLCREGQDPPPVGSYVHVLLDGVKFDLSGTVSGPMYLASSYAVSHFVSQ